MSKYDALYQAIGYRFGNEALLDLALTHASMGASNYERLEFLGDALLDFAVGEYLYRTYPDSPEGRLTKMRAQMVSNAVMCRLFDEWHLVAYLRSQNLSLRSLSEKVRANFVESLVGAVYLDGGMDKALDLIHTHLCVDLAANSDCVSQLYEWCAINKRHLELNEERKGSAQHPRFAVVVTVDGERLAFAEADSIKHAKQQACRRALTALGICTR